MQSPLGRDEVEVKLLILSPGISSPAQAQGHTTRQRVGMRCNEKVLLSLQSVNLLDDYLCPGHDLTERHPSKVKPK